MKDTFKEIPKGVLNRLEKITSRKEDNARISIDERYPGHTRSLAKTVINMNIFPTLKELLESSDEGGENEKRKKRKRKRGGKRNAYFCIGFSQLWW